MNYLNDIILGTYDPFWKSILINSESIRKVEKKNPDILNDMVYIHETFHWLQLTSSSLGHIVSLIPFIHKKIVSFAIEGPKLLNRRIKVKNPLIEEESQYSEIEMRTIRNDLSAIDLFSELIIQTTNKDELVSNFINYNQAMFSIFDMYLMYSREIITKSKGSEFYNDLVASNKDFWNRDNNYKVLLLSKDLPLLGFKDLVECAARIVEIKYYENKKFIYGLVNKDKSINEDYLYSDNYFRPLLYINRLFSNDTEMKIVFDFLLLAIHVSINPSIVPFYNSTYSEKNSISDIHPGMRFIKLLQMVKSHYGTIGTAMNDANLLSNIYTSLSWKSDSDHFQNLKECYNSMYEKVRSLDDGNNLIDISQIYDIEYYLYKYFRIMEMKNKYINHFIDINYYHMDDSSLEILKEIDAYTHCPVFYNYKNRKYQINKSGIIYLAMNNRGETESLLNLTKEKNDNIAQEYLNYITLGMYYDFDRQLLYAKNDLNYDIVNSFDIDDKTKQYLINQYKSEREISN